MSQRFVRCAHCGMPHALSQQVCPSTGKKIRAGERLSDRPPAPPSPSPSPSAKSSKPASAARIVLQRIPPRDLRGKTIDGKYLVRCVLGEGGMGTVFEAQHLTLGRMLAVKVLHPNQARKKDAVKRFHQEARAAGSIGHPNICEVYDLGTLDDGSPYLVMEKLVGETLADRIAIDGGLPYEEIIDVLEQVLSGLFAAHEKRILHRDIKPENVFLTRRVGVPPVAKLLDFGVSKVVPLVFEDRDNDTDLTRTGMVMGTPYYMSPEQARGERNLDARVDIYACGVMLYEALTGRRPFSGANYNALLMQILTGTPRPPQDLRPGLPAGFEAVVAKAMARDREHRYRNATEMQQALQALRPRDVARAVRAFRASPAPPKAPVRARVPTPSSIDIPIDFMDATAGSGDYPALPDDAPTMVDNRPAMKSSRKTRVAAPVGAGAPTDKPGTAPVPPEPSPEDTIKVEGDPTQILTQRSGRIPRR